MSPIEKLSVPLFVPTWEDVTSSIENSSYLTAEQRLLAMKAVLFYRNLFGESFFNKNNYNHPFYLKWCNTAPWQIDELITWMNTLEQLERIESNYDYLISKLKPGLIIIYVV